MRNSPAALGLAVAERVVRGSVVLALCLLLVQLACGDGTPKETPVPTPTPIDGPLTNEIVIEIVQNYLNAKSVACAELLLRGVWTAELLDRGQEWYVKMQEDGVTKNLWFLNPTSLVVVPRQGRC